MEVYQENYDITFREKYTGFENITELDRSIRAKLKLHLADNEIQNTYEEIVAPEVTTTFREELKNNAARYADTFNLIYLSGGVDSEVTARAFLDAGVQFTPVIFIWVDSKDNVLNEHDTVYAFDFCSEFNLEPIIRKFDIETFWSSDELYEYCDKYMTSSPQILTYYKMVALIDKEISDGTIEKV